MIMNSESIESLGSAVKSASVNSLVGGLGSAALGGLSSFFGNKLSMNNTRKLMREQFELANKQQQQSYRNMMAGMMSAGMNPAFSDANPSAAATPSASFDAQSPDLSGALTSGFQLSSLIESVKAQRLANVGKQLENKEKFLDLLNKQANLEEYGDLYAGAKGSLEGKRDIGELNTQILEQGARASEVDARKASAKFQTMLDNARISDPAVIKAFVNMPKRELEKLNQEINKLGLEGAYQKLVNERYESTSITAFIKKIESPDLSFSDKLIALLALAAQSFLDRR